MSKSLIEWTGQTWNPIAGCEAISPGCAHCYAATMTRRLEAMGQADYAGLTTKKHFNGVVRCLPEKLAIPLKRRKPTTWFVNSMSDLFHVGVPFAFVDKVFAVMALCQQHTFQVLTKRAERMAEYIATRTPMDDSGRYPTLPQWHQQIENWLDDSYGGGRFFHTERAWDAAHDASAKITTSPLPNVWLGVSCEDQQRADERIPWLLKTPAAVRFLSCEPLLGPLRWVEPCGTVGDAVKNGWGMIDWVIAGGESGPGARPCDVAWIRSIVGQCKAAGVACFVKQLGAYPFDGGRPLPFTAPCGMKEIENRLRLKDKKGGDIQEFPINLRVREFPREAAHV